MSDIENTTPEAELDEAVTDEGAVGVESESVVVVEDVPAAEPDEYGSAGYDAVLPPQEHPSPGSIASQIVVIGGVEYDQRYISDAELAQLRAKAGE